MHLPSDRIGKEMSSEDASLWFVPANNGTEIAALLKAPTTSIKALISGCKFELLLALENKNLCLGIRIFDIPDAPLLISGVPKHLEEHLAFQAALRTSTFPIFLYNEMDF